MIKLARSHFLRVLVVAAVILLLQGGRAMAGSQDFTLHNETGFDIYEVYVSAHSADNWEDDILGKDTLPNGQDVEITFPARDNTDDWDLEVVDANGKKFYWLNLQLTQITDVTISFRNGKAHATWKNGS